MTFFPDVAGQHHIAGLRDSLPELLVFSRISWSGENNVKGDQRGAGAYEVFHRIGVHGSRDLSGPHMQARLALFVNPDEQDRRVERVTRQERVPEIVGPELQPFEYPERVKPHQQERDPDADGDPGPLFSHSLPPFHAPPTSDAPVRPSGAQRGLLPHGPASRRGPRQGDFAGGTKEECPRPGTHFEDAGGSAVIPRKDSYRPALTTRLRQAWQPQAGRRAGCVPPCLRSADR